MWYVEIYFYPGKNKIIYKNYILVKSKTKEKYKKNVKHKGEIYKKPFSEVERRRSVDMASVKQQQEEWRKRDNLRAQV